MALPYQNATAGDRALQDIQKILRGFGCAKFGALNDFETGEIIVQFQHRERQVELRASAKGYAAAWLKENPWSTRRSKTEAAYKAKALEIGSVAIYSILRDWIKGQVTAVEIGLMDFDAAFLSHIMLPDGRRVGEAVRDKKFLALPEAE